jgi:hypothetical protein
MDLKDAASALEWSTAERRFQSSSKNEYSNERQNMLLSDANRRNRLTETWIELQIKHMAVSSVEADVWPISAKSPAEYPHEVHV